MPDKDNLGAVLQPIGYRWQNNRDGLQQDDAVAAMRASTGSSGFHEMNHPVVVAHAFYSTGGTHGVNQHPEVSPAVKVGSGLGIPSPPAVAQAMTVRRLTPRECERLQGFPDDYTLIPWRKKSAEDCPDGPRYKALGNSMATNVVTWIGERIQAYETETKVRAAQTMDSRGNPSA
jgi:DNA (cytosine-5)-methyltransferase 1